MFSTGDGNDDDTSCKVILSNRKMSNVRLELNMAIHIEAAMRLLNSLRLSEDRRKEAHIQRGKNHFSPKQMSISPKLSIFDPKLIKPKCG